MKPPENHKAWGLGSLWIREFINVLLGVDVWIPAPDISIALWTFSIGLFWGYIYKSVSVS